MKNIFRNFLLVSITILSFFFFQSDNTRGCGPEADYDYPLKGIFDPSQINEPNLQPYFFAGSLFYNYDEKGSLGSTKDNIDEWAEYFNNEISAKDISEIIYKASVEDLKQVLGEFDLFYPLKKVIKIDQNELIQSLIKNKDKQTIKYLIYAKQCEPYVIDNRKNYWDNLVRDSVAMSALIDSGSQKCTECKNEFLKLRYAYQIIRLALYSKQYEKTIKLYNEFVEPSNVSSIIKYWSLSDKAGALRRTDHFPESMYLFSLVYDKCISRRLTASMNFFVRSYSELNDILSFCKNDHEKAVVWFLHAYGSNDFGAMWQLYKLEPSSPYLEVLLTRAIDYTENDVLKSWREHELPQIDNAFLDLNSDNFYNFIVKCAKSNKTKRPYFWYYSAGYLAMMKNDYDNVETNFKKAKELLPVDDDYFSTQIRFLSIINNVEKQPQIDKKFEAKILPEILWLRSLHKDNSDAGYQYLFNMLSKRYKNQGEVAKSELCIGHKPERQNWDVEYNYLDYTDNPSNDSLDQICYFLRKNHVTDYEKFLISNFKYSLSDIIELQGTVFLQKFNFEKAVEKFKEDTSKLKPLPADPFVIHMKDCQDCDDKAPKERIYTKLTFAKRMIELEKLAKKYPSKSAEYYFLIANGYYNITWYGNSWETLNYFKSSLWDYQYAPRQTIFTDCSKAQEYYVKAMNETGDKEFAARCCFMAAKCEQNKYYNDSDILSFDSNPWIKESKYKTFFNKLADEYSKTKFYGEAIKECKYFNIFVLLHN